MANLDPFFSTLPIERKSVASFSREGLLQAEDALSPLILTNAFSTFPRWQSFAQDTGRLLCETVEAAGPVYAECAANDDLAGIPSPRYYGGERFVSNDEVHSSHQVSPYSAALPVASSTNPSGGPSPAAISGGGGGEPGALPTPHVQQQAREARRAVQGRDDCLRKDASTPEETSGQVKYLSAAWERSPRNVATPNSRNVNFSNINSGSGQHGSVSSPQYAMVGGIDIIDDEEHLRRSLLSLKVAALQTKKAQQQRHHRRLIQRRRSASTRDHLSPVTVRTHLSSPSARSASADDLSVGSFSSENALATSASLTTQSKGNADPFSTVGSRRPAKQPVLSLWEARQILTERRGTAPVGSSGSSSPSSPVSPTPSQQQEGAGAIDQQSVCEAGKVKCGRTGVREATPTSSDPHLLAVTQCGLATRESLLNGSFSNSNGTHGEFTSLLHDALRSERGCLYVKAPLPVDSDALSHLEVQHVTFSSPADLEAAADQGATQFNSPQRGGAGSSSSQPGSPLGVGALNTLFNVSGEAASLFQPQQYFPSLVSTYPSSPQQPDRSSFPAPPHPSGTPPPPFERGLSVSRAVSSPLLLQPGAYCGFVLMAEKGAGTRAHVNVKGSHAWHILLSGRKDWIVVHPLDKHLVVDGKTGRVANLFDVDETLFPHARHARVYRFTQEPGELVFVPAEAVHMEMTIAVGGAGGNGTSAGALASGDDGRDDVSVSLLVNFMDGSNYMSFLKYTRAHLILQSPRNTESLQPEIMPLTTVDLVLFDDNVYPSFRGSHRAYRPHSRINTVLLRGMTQFSQIRMPCSELGARLELEALQNCFSFLGETMLNEYDPPRYAVGVPKGYLVSECDNRLVLYYFVEPFSLKQIAECLEHQYIQQRRHRRFQYYHNTGVTLPAIRLFRSTVSHQGRIPNYVPLSVLLNQIWPFERDLCRKMVNLPHIILDKAYHPLGFIRPGSVWHYSRFDIKGKPEALASPCTCTEAATSHDSCKGVAEEAEKDAATVKTRQGSPPSRALGVFNDEGSSFGDVITAHESLEEQPGNGWCRTFLFYCSPLLDTPVAMHPVEMDGTLLSAALVAESSDSGNDEALASYRAANPAAATPTPDSPPREGRHMHSPRPPSGGGRRGHRPPPDFTPRILEFAWNANRLEEYGMVSLLEFSTDALAEIRRKILTGPCFKRFETFVTHHCLSTINHEEGTNIKKVMSVVLWFMCRPAVVGYTIGAAHGMDEDGESDGGGGEDAGGAGGRELAHEPVLRRAVTMPPMNSGGGGRSSPPSPMVQAPGSPLKVGAGATDDDNFTAVVDQWDTVCLTATAASALLSYERGSCYAGIATRLCNWLCDRPEEQSPEREQTLFDWVEDIIRCGDAEEQAVVFEVIKIKQRCLAEDETPIRCTPVSRSDHLVRESVNGAKLTKLLEFCHHIELSCEAVQ